MCSACGQSRKIPTSQHHFEENGSTVVLPYLKPSSTIKFLLDTDPWLLLGGLQPGDRAQTLLDTFWKAYRNEHPSHEVYTRERNGRISFKFTIPLLLHGDGARTLLKQPLEVVSMQAALGLDTLAAKMTCRCEKTSAYSGDNLSDPCCLRLNCKHNSYLTHFLMFAFPSKKYKTTPGLLKSMLEVTSQDLANVCIEGVVCGNHTYHFAVLGMKGDMEYHTKIGTLTRSYQNVGSKNMIKVCHECHAGAPQFPFEDFRSDARWKTTLYTDVPWEGSIPFHHLPFEPWDEGRAACFFKRDPFHIFRLGIARNLIGSSVVLLCQKTYFDAEGDSCAVDSRLLRAWSNFALWCHANGVRTAGIRSFSRDKLHYKKADSFPWVGCKGSDTIHLLKWLEWFGRLHLISSPHADELKLIVKACSNGLRFQGIHRHGIFFTQDSCKQTIISSCKRFCHAYAELASLAHSQGFTLYGMVPKAHAFAHIYHALEISTGPATCNPALYDCSMDEDFVGQVARQSRRVSYRHTVQNTLLAYKVKARLVIQRFKKKHRMWAYLKLKKKRTHIAKTRQWKIFALKNAHPKKSCKLTLHHGKKVKDWTMRSQRRARIQYSLNLYTFLIH